MKRLNLNIDDRTAARLARQQIIEERSATEIVRRALEAYFDSQAAPLGFPKSGVYVHGPMGEALRDRMLPQFQPPTREEIAGIRARAEQARTDVANG